MLSNFDARFFNTEILVDTLDPPIIASEGFNVVTTTFAPFQTMRCCEQINGNGDK